MDVTAFRKAFPEFNNSEVYTTDQIEFWASIAEMQLPQKIWCRMWANACFLYVAHEITIAKQNADSAKVGGTPGQQGGTAQSKTVGSMTVAYDTQSISEKDAGFWNLTSYGKQLFRLMNLFGAKAIQL